MSRLTLCQRTPITDDTVENLLGTNDDEIPMDGRVCRAVEKVRNEVKASATPDLPLFISEWNVQGIMDARDTIFMGPALANTVRQCDGTDWNDVALDVLRCF